MRPACLETEQRIFQAYPDVPLLYSYYDVINSEGNIRSKRLNVRAAHVKTSGWALQIMFFHGSISGNIANLSIRREFFAEVGPFREDMLYAADFEFLVRTAKSHPMCCITQPLLFLRAHAEQFSQAPWAYRYSMLETEQIYQTLIELLPSEMDRQYLRNYHWFHRRRANLHHIVRVLLSGKASDARLLYSEFRRLPGNHIPLLVVLYFLTINGRLCPAPFRPRYTEEVRDYGGFDSLWHDGLRGPHYRDVLAREGFATPSVAASARR